MKFIKQLKRYRCTDKMSFLQNKPKFHTIPFLPPVKVFLT